MKHDYFYTGNHGKTYPPLWSWRKDCALSFYSEEIAEQWIKKLLDSGIKTNYGMLIDGVIVAMYVVEV
jgi:hypothetical protein